MMSEAETWSRAAIVYQVDLNAAAIERHVGAVNSDERGKAFNCRILQDNVVQLLLPLRHSLK